MSNSPVGPSDKELETLDHQATQEQIDNNTAGEAQVADDRDPVRDVGARRDARDAVNAAEDTIASSQWVGTSMETIGSAPQNTATTRTYDPEKIEARNNSRSVPIFLPAERLIAWVDRDPQRAHAVILNESSRDQPREELIKVLSQYVGTSGADVRAEAQAEERDRKEREDAMIADFKERVAQ